MRQLLILIIAFFICGKVSAQYQPIVPTAYGSNNNRIEAGIAILLPTGCGKPSFMSLYSVDSMHIAIKGDSCNSKVYWYNPHTRSWIAFSDSTSSSGNSDSLQHIIGTNYILYGGTGITTGSTSYSIAAGTMIDKIIFYDPATIYVSIGTSVNLRDISAQFTIASATYSIVNLNKYYPTTANIYFNGVTASTIIKIYKQ